MYDFHTHSTHSFDGFDSMETMVKKAVQLGLEGFAFTEHWDPEYQGEDTTIDIKAYWEAVNEISDKYAGSIYIAKGLEVGMQHGRIADECLYASTLYPWDFILASIHVVDGIAVDIEEFLEGRTTDQLLSAYYRYFSLCMDEFDDYDVLAHLNIVDRHVDLTRMGRAHMPLVKDILQKAVERGKGIEINTSSFRKGLGEWTTPTQEMVDLYVSLGGEIITIGSDAHSKDYLGYKSDFAVDMIKKAGLSHYATFSKRKPVFHKI